METFEFSRIQSRFWLQNSKKFTFSIPHPNSIDAQKKYWIVAHHQFLGISRKIINFDKVTTIPKCNAHPVFVFTGTARSMEPSILPKKFSTSQIWEWSAITSSDTFTGLGPLQQSSFLLSCSFFLASRSFWDSEKSGKISIDTKDYKSRLKPKPKMIPKIQTSK